MKRQGIVVTVEDLRELADRLERNAKQESKQLGLKYTPNKKFLITIINKTGYSDDWVLES